MTAWYDLTPAQYATSLRWRADRNYWLAEQLAEYYAGKDEYWLRCRSDQLRRAARRLRAMAILCDHSPAARAGDVDFLGMSRPDQSFADEVVACVRAEALAKEAS